MYSISILAVILPLAAAAPHASSQNIRQITPSCAAASSSDFYWTVENFEYRASWIFQNPAHQWASGNVNFSLVNLATDAKFVCAGGSSQLQDFFYGTQIFTCQGEGDRRPTWTFSWPTKELKANETWTCSEGENPQYPDANTTFTARGAVVLPLQCTDTGVVENPDWEPNQPGNFYSTRYLNCDKVTVPMKAYEVIQAI